MATTFGDRQLDPSRPPRITELEITTPTGDRFHHTVQSGTTAFRISLPPIGPHRYEYPDDNAEFRSQDLIFGVPPPGTSAGEQGFVIRNLTPSPRQGEAYPLPFRIDSPLGVPAISEYLRRGEVFPDEWAEVLAAAGPDPGPHHHIMTAENVGEHVHASIGTLNEASIFPTKKLIEVLRNNVELRTRLTLNGTDLIIRTQMVVKDEADEVIVAEDEDSVDLQELLDQVLD